MTTRKFSFRGPAEAQAPFRVTVLLTSLWECDLLPGSQEALQRLVDAWGNPYPELRRSAAMWAKEYLKSDNPALVPFILKYLEEWAQVRDDSVYRANKRLESIARDPAVLLPRPGNRIGRELYSSALDRHREAEDITIDGLRAWEHAEAWIKVRHGLTRLADHVKAVGTRQYKKSDGELRLNNNNSYLWWWRNLKAVDAAIEAIVWPIPSSSN